MITNKKDEEGERKRCGQTVCVYVCFVCCAYVYFSSSSPQVSLHITAIYHYATEMNTKYARSIMLM